MSMVYPSELPGIRVVYNTTTKQVEGYRGTEGSGNALPKYIQAATGDLYYKLSGKTFSKEGSLYRRVRDSKGKLSMQLFKQCVHRTAQVSCSNE